MERLKEKKVLVLITSVLCLLPMIVGLIFYKKLPEQIATHFNSLGEADGYSSRAFAVFGTGAIMLGVHLLCLFITTADPKNRNVSDKVMDLIFWVVPAVSLYITFLLYGKALGFDFDVSNITILFMGVLLTAIGNYLPKCRQNYTIGIKVPWALNDAENWDRTHRFGGYVFMICGILCVLMALFVKNAQALLMPVMLVCVAAPVVYSYLLYRKKNVQ
ncbi:MAG: SdpI family protein [Erysipelotrichaceae bacterium]|nr:SdpI family protein [Erysipelotrichaceae bacterium]